VTKETMKQAIREVEAENQTKADEKAAAAFRRDPLIQALRRSHMSKASIEAMDERDARANKAASEDRLSRVGYTRGWTHGGHRIDWLKAGWRAWLGLAKRDTSRQCRASLATHATTEYRGQNTRRLRPRERKRSADRPSS
jgi:hypothetical protein